MTELTRAAAAILAKLDGAKPKDIVLGYPYPERIRLQRAVLHMVAD